MSIAIVALVLFAGLGVGLTGIGGVVVVPGLSALADMPLTRAVPASTLAFLFTGLVATWRLQAARRCAAAAAAPADTGTGAGPAAAARERRALVALLAAALVGAALGALSLRWVSGTGMHLALAALALGSGVQSLLGRPVPEDAVLRPRPWALAGIGLAVGIGSAWSGTGGPILLLPALVWLAVPTRAAIAMAQAVQLPIALAATAVNAGSGQLDWALGSALGAVLVAGWLAGDRLAARLPVALLRRLMGGLLVLLGLWYAFHILK